MTYSNNTINNDYVQSFVHTLPGKNSNITEQNAGHVYVASLNAGKMEQEAVFSVKMLRNKADEQYITAAAFYHPTWGRNNDNMRWINGMVLDFDGQQDPQELAIKIADAGLPPASMMIRTPSGGIHVWWWLKPVRGTPKAIRLYESLQASLAAELGADTAAIGAERLWRLPTSANVIYSSKRKYKLSVFRNWRDENRPQDMPGQGQKGQVYAFTAGLLAHPAIKQLQNGVKQGQRDNACFALAVAYLISGYNIFEAEQILLTWNQLNSPVMREEIVYKCVTSAVKGLKKDCQHYYNAMRLKIREITGFIIKYRPITKPKAREDRVRSHLYEREQDLIAHIQDRGGRMLTSLSRLAKESKIPLSSLKKVLKKMEREGIIFRDAVGEGRKSFTTLILNTNYVHKCKKQMGHTGIHYGEKKNRGCGRGTWGPACCNQPTPGEPSVSDFDLHDLGVCQLL